MNLRYKITPVDSIRYHATILKHTPDYLKQRATYNYARIIWLALWAYALAISIVFVDSIAATLLVAGLLVFQMRLLLPFDVHLGRLSLERYGSAPVRELELKIEESGLTEAEGEVALFVPWPKVEVAELQGSLLIIRAQSGHDIVLSRHSLEPEELSLESILAEVSARSTSSRPA